MGRTYEETAVCYEAGQEGCKAEEEESSFEYAVYDAEYEQWGSYGVFADVFCEKFVESGVLNHSGV